ncbi:EAL domain-containing protein [Gluconacetobacter azotocaptans]|uniref:EAL domain-containing protein n=1 Tax=Gluconacetobacter azotocaptans TaxID=142834 RepID=A0A7W4JST5_9PROT|nr:EAL domain-containing protein [Gluconacetobacter azotocaptans]MBB2190207.1 EAL domain-containing protein [Gluconacetobacter azotocaptans]GBQ29849.1 putative diguanylate cyclase [Gluconacetobacter azotocaptans DSM 13594]
MTGILGYVVLKHDLVGTGLSVLLCLLSSYGTMTLLDRARHGAEGDRRLWIGGAGAAGGFGIWATHFIAMLAYRPGIALWFRPAPTVLSLLIAILATAVAIGLAAGHGIARPARRAASVGAAVIFGLGVAAMHFIGMSAVRMPGHMLWNGGLAALSVAIGIALSLAAFLSARRHGGTPLRRLVPAALLALSIAGLHFTAMAAVTMRHVSMATAAWRMQGPALSSAVLIALIGIVAVALISIGLAAAFFALRAERAVHKSDLAFRLLVEGVRDHAIYMLDPQGHISTWNAGAERLKGYTSAEALGRYFGEHYSEPERQAGEPQRVLAEAAMGTVVREAWHYRKDGTPFWASATIEPLRDAEDGLIGFAHVTRDRTKQKEDGDRIARITRNLDVALENMSQGLCLFGADGRLILANGRCAELFGLAVQDIRPGMEYRAFLTCVYATLGLTGEALRRRVDEACDLQMAVIRQGQDGQFLLRLRDERAVQVAVCTTADGGWVETYEDITQRLEAEARIAYLAHHDGLTGLANRAQFNDMLRRDLMLAERVGQRLAVICIDLDKFKAINDQHGHAAGDQVLKVLAERIRETKAEDELVARLGGDEFAAAKRFYDIAELDAFIGRLEACLSQPIVLDGFELRPDASFGVSLFPQDADTVDALMVNADLAMYRAKAALRERICFYQAEMDEAARSRRSLAAALWEALDREQFHLNFQVQKKVSNGDISGFEVLLRWRHPEWGMVPPMDFIPLAEECGAILPIGEWVLRAACRTAAGWPHPYKIAVNLSAVQLGDDGLADLVGNILTETGLEPHRLELEMTETSIVVDKVRSLRTLRRIKAMGVSIAIDDFGVGYSSLETLRTFPFDKIKLDRSFMNEIEHSPESKAILRAILALGRSLNIPVLAEGVETRFQLDILNVEGCTEAQGYFLGRPGPLAPDVVTAPADA